MLERTVLETKEEAIAAKGGAKIVRVLFEFVCVSVGEREVK